MQCNTLDSAKCWTASFFLMRMVPFIGFRNFPAILQSWAHKALFLFWVLVCTDIHIFLGLQVIRQGDDFQKFASVHQHNGFDHILSSSTSLWCCADKNWQQFCHCSNIYKRVASIKKGLDCVKVNDKELPLVLSSLRSN